MSEKQDYLKHLCVENSISQIAVKRKYNDFPTGLNNEVVLLNGKWDTSNSIPNIVAEMHNVELEELQGTWGGESSNSVLSANLSNMITNNNGVSDSATSETASQSDIITDDYFSWLVNFKLDDLIHTSSTWSNIDSSEKSGDGTEPFHIDNTRLNPSIASKYNHVYIADALPKQYYTQQNQIKNGKPMAGPPKPLQTNFAVPGGQIHNGNQNNRYSGPRKPPFTYTELIEQALHEKGELTVSGIYQWISDHFPFYKSNDDRWKNSVRHNLSINPHFRKGSKAVHGAGHLWTIAQKDDKKISAWMMKQKMQTFMENFNDQDKAMEDELQAATASILPDIAVDTTEIITNITRNGQKSKSNRTSADISEDVKHEIQYIIPISSSMDFMNPISKEQVAEECGLRSDKLQELSSGDFLITDLNPQTLGLNLSETEIVTSEQLFGEDLNFQCYELQP